MKVIAPILLILTILLQLHSVIGCHEQDAQVLIVGGGPAGIQAAATLVENGIDDYLIIEDGEQLRGYLESVEFGGHTFAPGSLFGYTPIRDKLDELDVSYSYSDIFSYTAYSDQGENITNEARERFFAFASSVGLGFADFFEDLDNNVKADISQKAAVARGGWSAYTPVDKLLEWWSIEFHFGLSPRDTSTTNSFRQSGSLSGALGEYFRTPYFILDDRTLAYPLLSTQEGLIKRVK